MGGQDPVEKAEAKVAELKAEEKGLLEQTKALESYIDEDVGLEDVKKAGVGGLGKNPTTEVVQAKLAELEGNLKSVNKQLELALKMQLVAAQREEQREEQPQSTKTVQELQRSIEGLVTVVTRLGKASESSSSQCRSWPGSQKYPLDKCWVCGKNELGVSRAHIVPTTGEAERLSVPYRHSSNMLHLCGTKGTKDSCHHLFDEFHMSFIPNNVSAASSVQTATEWKVCGGGKYAGRVVTFPNKPHTRALRCHLNAYAVLAAAREKANDENNDSILEWQARVTPPDSPEKDQPVAPHVCNACQSLIIWKAGMNPPRTPDADPTPYKCQP